MEIIKEITNDVIYKLSKNPTNKTPEIIRNLIAYEANDPTRPVKLSPEQIESIARDVEHQFGFTMEEGTMIVDDNQFEPWYEDKKIDKKFNPYFWNRYDQLLLQRDFPPLVVSSIDNVTNKIVGRLGNPSKPGHWYRRGMVVGHVQSGKTANFIGVINKASDVGYKLIIILAGMQETLRSQTQERIDDGYIGQDSSKKHSVNLHESLIGVGHINHEKRPLTFTDKHTDFKNNQNFEVQRYDDATILVVKKNTTVLLKLKEWLKKNNSNIDGSISTLPLLMIDDEADHASLNTNDKDKDPTRINERIREILHLFDRKCYLAYTATPFANIFINPDTSNEMLGDELFPRDFIISLDPPSNYVGSERIFGSISEEKNLIRYIDSNIEDFIPIKHKSNFEVSELPPSLIISINSNIISKTIRIILGQTNKHHSMLVHLSRYKKVQKDVYDLIVKRRQDIEKGVRYSYKLDDKKALTNPYMSDLFQIWKNDFSKEYSDWNNVQEKLLEAVASMQVRLINGDSDDSLNYKDYKNGLNVIAVGGDKLSRGLTLDGLATSYFYRSTSMYDTLMQMGRWFGFRDGFANLCRIYLTSTSEGYFSHISATTEELRLELKDMLAANLTPKDFGLKVRTHPDTLLITAKNKMRTATIVRQSTNLKGKLIESTSLDLIKRNKEDNWREFETFVSKLSENYPVEKNKEENYLFTKVPISYIIEFVSNFKNHKKSHMTDTQPVLMYLENAKAAFKEWDIVIINVERNKEKVHIKNLNIGIQKRTCTPDRYHKDRYLEITSRRRVGNETAEKAGMGKDEIENAVVEYLSENKESKESKVTGLYLRRHRIRPLLMLHIINAYGDIKDETTLLEKNLFAYGMSFPNKGPHVEEVEFAVNTTYVKEHSEGYEDDEE